MLVAASVLLLLACCSQHAEGRANKGPGHYRPRLADHMKAAGRMVYVAAQDDPSPHHSVHGPPHHHHPVHAAAKHAAHHPHKSAAAASAAARGGTAPAAVTTKKDDKANEAKQQDAAAAHAAAVKAATGKTLVKVPTSDSKPEARPAAAPAPAPAAAASSNTVAAALMDIGNAPVHFRPASKPADDPSRQLNTPQPVLKADQQQEQKPALNMSAPQAPSNLPVNTTNPAGQAFDTVKPAAGSDKQPGNAFTPAVAGSSPKQGDKPAEGSAGSVPKPTAQQQVSQPAGKSPADAATAAATAIPAAATAAKLQSVGPALSKPAAAPAADIKDPLAALAEVMKAVTPAAANGTTADQPKQSDAPAAEKPAATATAPQVKPQSTTQQQQQAAVENDEDISIFSVKKVHTPDGKIEVLVKPLKTSTLASISTADSTSSAGNSASVATAAAPGAPAAAATAPKACTKQELSSHEADIAFTAGQNGVSLTTLSASCAAAAPTLLTLGGGCSLKCDFEEDLSKITLVKAHSLTDAREAGGDKPAACSYQASSGLKGNCKAILQVACCADSALPVSVSTQTVSSSSSSSSSAGLLAAAHPQVNLTITNAAKPTGVPANPAMQPLSVAQMLEQAAAALQIKQQVAQALVMQHIQQMQADLLASQARLAAAGARAQENQMATDMQRMALLSAATWGWNPMPAMGQGFAGAAQNPALGLLQAIAPQFPAAATSQAADSQAAASAQAQLQSVSEQPSDASSAATWNSAANAAAAWRDGMSKLLATSAAWWPFGGAA